ncbi:alpha/beta fold hydrolase [Halorarius litoreus]|uniref:alpha/beta fold hydrolase n=1 Tax=Halorarius litoreus TaxID=2962676 RepID=UPI0020CFA162|nr:alpha/beta fold hydrolase [Halorarius litoreus]
MNLETRYNEALDALATHHDIDVESRLLDVDVPPVERVHTLVAGDGPPLLFLHGVGVAATSWLPLMAALADDYTCYALDRPGRGRSSSLDHTAVDFRSVNADVLTDVMDELGVDSCPVVGNSFGGLQALLLALDRPDRVESLALLGAPAGLSGDFPLATRLGSLRWIGPKLVALAEPDDIEGARELWGRVAVVDENHLSEPFLAAYLAECAIPGTTESLASVFRDSLRLRGARPEYLIREEVTGVDHQTLFVWGSEDQYFAPEVGRPVADAMPDTRFVELDGLGHAPWLEPDTRAVEATRAFLDGERDDERDRDRKR